MGGGGWGGGVRVDVYKDFIEVIMKMQKRSGSGPVGVRSGGGGSG